MTIFEAYNETKKKLQKAGIEDFVFEAKEIIKHITNLSATQILMNYNKPLTDFQKTNLTAIIRQREIRYPLQYIFGSWDFYGNSFYVGPGVLVPRADTEVLVEECLSFLKGKENPKVLDLCAGTGCIGITLAKEIPTAKVILVEKYQEAAAYLDKNISLNKTENAKYVLGDIFEAAEGDKQYDLIVSNPPYIPEKEMSIISPETEFEPKTALLANEEGLQFYRAIIKNYKALLNKGGMMAFEVGIGEAQRVYGLLAEAEFKDIQIKKDLNNIERVVFAFTE